MICPGLSMSLKMDIAVTDLPLPLWPTTAVMQDLFMSREMSSTALTT